MTVDGDAVLEDRVLDAGLTCAVARGEEEAGVGVNDAVGEEPKPCAALGRSVG
jgi:hypothetical protein